MNPQTLSWCRTNEKFLSSGHHGGLRCAEYEELRRVSAETGKKVAQVVYEALHGRTSCVTCGAPTTFKSYARGFADNCNGCKNAAAARKRKSNRLIKLAETNPSFRVLSTHGINDAPIDLECGDCGHTFSVWMKNGRETARCPRCRPGTKSSHEYELVEFMRSIGVETVHGYRLPNTKNGRGVSSVDVFAPEINLAIEINGLHWHSDDPGRHSKKRQSCAELGVRLLQFTDEQWTSRRGVCEAMIKSACGKNDKIHARECEVVELSAADYRDFCDANHIDGYSSASVKLGLVHRGALVQVMSLSRPRFDGKYDWEIVRSCTVRGFTVVGGVSKLFSRRPAGSVVSYACSDWYDGRSYRALGMREDGHTPPSYLWHRAGRIVSRYAAFKRRLPKLLGDSFDPALSEVENMERAGYRRYWNCGNTRWVLDK